jgi:crotonobetainyl-CoA:carnitine CoA-transferase CaiB-like acyl-CoA transferase
MLLGDLGAEIIKVERPGHGDIYRRQGPDFINGESTTFLSLNRNKKSITLHLKKPRGIEIATELIRRVDVLVENFKPGTARRLGLGYDAVHKVNPELVYCSISGYGQTGPRSEQGGYDLMVQGMGGLMSVTGKREADPVKAGLPVFDFGGALLGVVGILSALISVRETGLGQHVDVSLLDCAVSWLTVLQMGYSATGKVPGRMGTASHTFAPYQAYRARDGYLTVVGTGGKDSWGVLCRVLGLDGLVDDPRFRTNATRIENLDELNELIEAVLVTKDVAFWLEKLEQAGLPCGPINTLDDVLSDPQVQAREMIQELRHPVAGALKMVGIPIKFSETPGALTAAPPQLGEHTDAILAELGYSEEEIASLRNDEVI